MGLPNKRAHRIEKWGSQVGGLGQNRQNGSYRQGGQVDKITQIGEIGQNHPNHLDGSLKSPGLGWLEQTKWIISPQITPMTRTGLPGNHPNCSNRSNYAKSQKWVNWVNWSNRGKSPKSSKWGKSAKPRNQGNRLKSPQMPETRKSG